MPISTQFITAALRAARNRKKLTQRALSKRTKIPQSHISKIENGTVDLHTSSLLELARSLDLEVVLVPRTLVTTVQALITYDGKDTEEQIPMYRLDPEEDEDEYTETTSKFDF